MGNRAHDRALPHWIPGLIIFEMGIFLFRVPLEGRQNLLAARAKLLIAGSIVLTYSLYFSDEKAWHKLHHVAMSSVFLCAACASFAETKKYLLKGSSNMLLAAAEIAAGVMMVGHLEGGAGKLSDPKSGIVEDRGHMMVGLGMIFGGFAVLFATNRIGHILASFFWAWAGYVFFSLGFFWCKQVHWWGNQATEANPHRDMMILHMFAGIGAFLIFAILVSIATCRSSPQRQLASADPENPSIIPNAIGSVSD